MRNDAKPKRRGPGRPFKKGQVSNPKGRPKAFRGFREWCRQIIEEQGGKEIIQKRAMDHNDREQGFFMKLLIEYAYGKAPQPITGEGGEGPAEIVVNLNTRAK